MEVQDPMDIRMEWMVNVDDSCSGVGGPRGNQRGPPEEVRQEEENLRGRPEEGGWWEPVCVSWRRGRGVCRPALDPLEVRFDGTQQPRRRGHGLLKPALSPL